MPSDEQDNFAEPATGFRRWVLRWIGFVVLGAIIAAFLTKGPNASSIWDTVHTNLGVWQDWTAGHTLLALAAFFLVYACATALPLPVVTVMSLLAGALFGRTAGTTVATLAYTTGVTTSFLVSRWLLRDWVLRHTGGWLGPIKRGVARDGAFYLLTLRLMPSVPFFLVNVLMALTPIRTRTYALVSWLGVLPITFLCAGIGTELADMQSPSEALSLPVIASLVALALLPLATRFVLRQFGTNRPEPEAFA
jgi:uncharacterized membrane protein YdjX (TVP38/TMEM64 family)